MKVSAETAPSDLQAKIIYKAEQILPRVLPGDWRTIKKSMNATTYKSVDGIKVILEVEAQEHKGETRLWLHASLSRSDRVPSYFDQKRVKEVFVGRDRKAISVLPAASEHYNFHPYCLHMWAPLEGDPLPDFRTPEGAL